MSIQYYCFQFLRSAGHIERRCGLSTLENLILENAHFLIDLVYAICIPLCYTINAIGD